MKLTKIKIVYLLEIIAVLLVVLGILPRELSLVLMGVLIFYIIFSSLEDGIILFIASVPIFIALPISEGFDSLSSARVLIVFLFLKWFFLKRCEIWKQLKELNFKKIFRNYRFEFFALLLFLVMTLSIMNAPDVLSAIKKVIYLLNLVMLYPLVGYLVKTGKTAKRTIRAVLISSAIVVLIALWQLISVYMFTIGDFWDWWADHFSLGFYGENLQQIVKNMNAWFTHSPAGPSVIRLFGSFTDPHSFALYLLLCVPFILILIGQLGNKIKGIKIVKKEIFCWLILILSLFFVILSGTRGIWLSVIFAIGACFYLIMRRLNPNQIVSAILLILLIFIALIPIASVFTTIPQFRESKQGIDATLLLKRLSSILNLDEESNSGRIYIWKKSLQNLKDNLWLGVGVGNFPLVLEQEIKLAKAGSSAHNLYLNFAVESGIFALILLILVFLETLLSIFSILKRNSSLKMRLLISALFIFLVWAFAYSLFDIALMDERVFLLFLTVLGMIYALKRNPEIAKNYE